MEFLKKTKEIESIKNFKLKFTKLVERRKKKQPIFNK